MKNCKYTLVISKQTRIKSLDISESVTALKIIWGDNPEVFDNERYLRLDELQKYLDSLLSAHNNIRILDLSELRWFRSTHYYLFNHENCHLEELYLPESEEYVWNDLITLRILSAPGAKSIFLQNTPKLTKII